MKYDVISFAQGELNKYLDIMGVEAEISFYLFKDIGIVDENVNDDLYDDAIEISVIGSVGYVAGSNERSILIGVYRLLSEWGIKWFRPGRHGTYIPKTSDIHDVFIHEAADKRHRTVCIEGAVSLENVIDMVDWLPKAGYNGYYIQFNDAFIFFDRWYSHRNNPFRAPEEFNQEKSLEYVDIITKEIKKRGLLLQRMGHGWTCEPFGIANHGWDPVSSDEISQSYVDICAEVKGERKVWMNMPIATQLCYSNPYVRKTMSDGVINYILEHSDTDIIHFWLGDYPNNTCECPVCSRERLSDFYAMMVNDITDKMKELGLKNKIVLIIYYNSAHPPVKEHIKSTDSTILMFAPISRTFGVSFPNEFKIKNAPKYETNSFALPRSVDENLSYLYAWEQCYGGDVVDFDYHLMWDHILDAGGEGIAKIIYQDVQNFDNLGMNGFISCQLQRNFFPSSIAMTVLAKVLWNKDIDFDQTKKELYAASFGNDCVDELCNYFATLSKGFDIGALRSQVKVDRAELRNNIQAALNIMNNFKKTIQNHTNVGYDCHRESWKLLELHGIIYSAVAEGILCILDGDKEAGDKKFDQAIRISWENEEKIQEVFDCFMFPDMIKSRINLEGEIPFLE